MINSISATPLMSPTIVSPAAKPEADPKERIGFWALFGVPDPPQSEAQTGSPSATEGPTDKTRGFWALFNSQAPQPTVPDPAPAPAVQPVAAARVPFTVQSTVPFNVGAGSIPWAPSTTGAQTTAGYQLARSRNVVWQTLFEEVKL